MQAQRIILHSFNIAGYTYCDFCIRIILYSESTSVLSEEIKISIGRYFDSLTGIQHKVMAAIESVGTDLVT